LDTRFVAVAAACVVVAAQAQPLPATKVDKEALERAEKQADGPRRRILEAARMKPAAVPALAAVAPPAPAPAPTPEPVLHTLGKGAAPLDVSSATVATVPTVAPVEQLPVSAAMIALPAPPPQTQAAVLPAPRLVNKVEPDLPSRLTRRGAPRTEVLLEMTVNADGSVSNVSVRASTNAEIQDAVVEAVRQWRYEAQPAARPHTVRLVVMPQS
jgi:TonB family protein